MSDSYDVIIIGSGAGGGTLAHRLAPSGKRILLLERGGWLPREPQNWRAESVFVDNRYVSPDTWHYSDGSAFQAEVHYWVGGATKRYGFKPSFNQTYAVPESPTGWWVTPYHFGIDQGPVILMIENYRTGLIWDIMRRCTYVTAGLRRAGFRGGWLGE